MLNETFHCKPPIAQNYQKFAPKDAGTTKNCLKEGVCMFQLSTRFCQAPFCWADNAPKSQCKRQCQNPVSVRRKTLNALATPPSVYMAYCMPHTWSWIVQLERS